MQNLHHCVLYDETQKLDLLVYLFIYLTLNGEIILDNSLNRLRTEPAHRGLTDKSWFWREKKRINGENKGGDLLRYVEWQLNELGPCAEPIDSKKTQCQLNIKAIPGHSSRYYLNTTSAFWDSRSLIFIGGICLENTWAYDGLFIERKRTKRVSQREREKRFISWVCYTLKDNESKLLKKAE